MSTMNGNTTRDRAAPDLLTVEEAARGLRIGRTKAFEFARLYLVSDAAEGLPVVRVGHLLRVPRHALEETVGAPITWPIPTDQSVTTAPTPRSPQSTAGLVRPANDGLQTVAASTPVAVLRTSTMPTTSSNPRS